jgi:glycosyltransferase involved in cell wall biosynthesis
MKMFDLDIAVIPLQDLEFNTFKSEIKFSEFAALRVPCLVKRMTPYKEVVKEGETGLMYETQEEFGEQLERLIKDEKLRKKISDNAYDWVRDERDLADWAPKVVDIYKEVYDGVVGRKSMKSDIIKGE